MMKVSGIPTASADQRKAGKVHPMSRALTGGMPRRKVQPELGTASLLESAAGVAYLDHGSLAAALPVALFLW
jgi:hypothetical protein